ncbi:hypothetical protein [Streptomyces anulatus]|uniref:hypothetical protein n=1 Tax=Streptomyces anulatus TaxID=1892 RepID=UPI002F907E60|nr:hypothetical protein OG865_38705 [Streptomyces anulatus]
MGPLTWVMNLFRRDGGMWGYLTERTKSRTAIELERERNAATVSVLPLLPPGTDFMESEVGGRTRVIRMMPVQSRDSGVAGGEETVPAASSHTDPAPMQLRQGQMAISPASPGPQPEHSRPNDVPQVDTLSE